MFMFGLLVWLMSLPLMAVTQVTTHIHEIDYGQMPGDEVLVYLGSGLVAKLPRGKSDLLFQVSTYKEKGGFFRLTLDSDRTIIAAEKAKRPAGSTVLKHMGPAKMNLLLTYTPTTIADLATAKAYHREARYNPKDSQCFNRAMVWTYEWWRNHSLRSGKILIYFTRTYIRRYDFEWWFHIAPYVHVIAEAGNVVERVMDIKYSSGPLDFRKWTNLFMRNDAECKVISNYSDYADHPYTGECYLQRATMYTYQPADLQMLEAWGYNKGKFRLDEVRAAYLEAFDENI